MLSLKSPHADMVQQCNFWLFPAIAAFPGEPLGRLISNGRRFGLKILNKDGYT